MKKLILALILTILATFLLALTQLSTGSTSIYSNSGYGYYIPSNTSQAVQWMEQARDTHQTYLDYPQQITYLNERFGDNVTSLEEQAEWVRRYNIVIKLLEEK